MARTIGSAFVPQPLPPAPTTGTPQEQAYYRALRRQVEMNLQDVSVQISRLYSLVPVVRGVVTKEFSGGSSTETNINASSVEVGDVVFVSVKEDDATITASGFVPEDGVIRITVNKTGGSSATITVGYQVLAGNVNELTTRVLT